MISVIKLKGENMWMVFYKVGVIIRVNSISCSWNINYLEWKVNVVIIFLFINIYFLKSMLCFFLKFVNR